MAGSATPQLTALTRVADQFAKNGYLTVIPDIWEGDNVPLDWDPASTFPLGQWFGKHGPERVVPIAESIIRATRELGVKNLGGVGYCLGAQQVCRFMASGKGIDAGFFAHPTAVTPEDVKGVAGPLSIAAAGKSCLSVLVRYSNKIWQRPITCSLHRKGTRRRRF